MTDECASGRPSLRAAIDNDTSNKGAILGENVQVGPQDVSFGAITLNGMQSYIQLMADAGVIKAAIPASEIVTNEFIDFANDFDHSSIRQIAIP